MDSIVTLGISLGLGLLIGLQRERTESRLGGIRTFPLISMFGTAGGIIGPWLTGALLARSGNFSLAIGVLASLLVLVLFLISFDRAGRSRM